MLDGLLIIAVWVVIPFLCLGLGGYGTFLLAKRDRISVLWRFFLLIALPAVCGLGVACLKYFNQATVRLNYFGDYFIPLVLAVILFAGTVCGSIMGGLHLICEMRRKRRLKK